MNEMRVETRGATEKPPAGPGLPLDLVIWTVRIVEFLTVIAAGTLATSWWLGGQAVTNFGDYNRVIFVAALAFSVLSETIGSYDVDAQFSLRQAWQRVFSAWLITALFMLTLAFLLKVSDAVPRAWAFAWFGSGTLMLLGTRVGMTVWVRRLKKQGTFNQRVAIFGAGPQGVRLAQYIQTHDKLTISIIGFFDDRRDGRVPASASDIPVLGNLAELMRVIRDDRVDQVIVALPWSAEIRLQEVVRQLAMTPVRIRLAPDLASFVFARRPVVLLGEMPVMTLFERPISGMDALVKSAEDKILGVIILLLIWPLLLLIAVAIKLDSPGPVFFRQPREGFNNKPFRVFKFRSMYNSAGQVDNIQQASKVDPRVTRVGALLRRTSLDELAQLFNVLLGDMSLVGPRPHAASTRAGGKLFSEVVTSYAARHKVKPGITGWAQVCGWRGETDTEDKLIKRFEHDLYYIENWSLFFDFYIMLRTAVALIVPRNAY